MATDIDDSGIAFGSVPSTCTTANAWSVHEFTMTEDDDVLIECFADNPRVIYMYLFRANGEQWISGDNWGRTSSNSRVSLTYRINVHLDAGTYYLVITNRNGEPMEYGVFVRGGQFDVPPEAVEEARGRLGERQEEAAEEAARERLVELQQAARDVSELEFQGQVPQQGEAVYRFGVTERGRVSIRTGNVPRESYDTILTLFNDRGITVAEDDDGGEGLLSHIQQTLDPGNYYVSVRGYSGRGGQFILRIEGPVGAPGDEESPDEEPPPTESDPDVGPVEPDPVHDPGPSEAELQAIFTQLCDSARLTATHPARRAASIEGFVEMLSNIDRVRVRRAVSLALRNPDSEVDSDILREINGVLQ